MGGVIIHDGTAVWIIDDLRDGTPVGAVRGSLYLPAGYVKANGATVQRADYPRLVGLADKHNLWTDDVTVHAGLFGRGDGAATFVLPNWTDRMVQLAGNGAGASVAAGLPNINFGYDGRFYVGSWKLKGQSIRVGETLTNNQGVTIKIDDGEYTYSGGEGSVVGGRITFDVSKSNPIYGASATVQPPAIKLLPILRY